MYKDLGDHSLYFEKYNLTYNHHNWGINPDFFETDEGLKEMFIVSAISRLDDGTPFTASIEGKKYPFYGT